MNAPTNFNVIAQYMGRLMPIGTVHFESNCAGEGWRFCPMYQSGRSRRLWPTAEAAVKARRIVDFKLEVRK